jgi:hypothetical protein
MPESLMTVTYDEHHITVKAADGTIYPTMT